MNNRNDCEALLHLHRTFLPRRRTGRGFLTGTVFLDAALLSAAFVLATAPFVRKPGILLELPEAGRVDGILFNDTVLTISREGLYFFNDERLDPDRLEEAFAEAIRTRPGAALILEADRTVSQEAAAAVYDAAARAGFKQVLIATQTATPAPR